MGLEGGREGGKRVGPSRSGPGQQDQQQPSMPYASSFPGLDWLTQILPVMDPLHQQCNSHRFEKPYWVSWSIAL